MTPPAPIIAALEDAGYRLTGPRRALAELISGREGATFTAADLVADVADAAPRDRAGDRLPGDRPAGERRRGRAQSTSRTASMRTSRACPPTTTTSSARAARGPSRSATSGSAPSPARWPSDRLPRRRAPPRALRALPGLPARDRPGLTAAPIPEEITVPHGRPHAAMRLGMRLRIVARCSPSRPCRPPRADRPAHRRTTRRRSSSPTRSSGRS